MKYKFNNLLQDNRVAVLFMTMLILVIMLTVVLGAANLVMSRIKMSGAQERSTIAYFAAEVGTERVLWEIRKNSFELKRGDDSDCQVGDYIYFDNTPTVCDNSEHDYSLSNNALYNVVYSSDLPVTFTSTGVFSGLRRSVDISY